MIFTRLRRWQCKLPMRIMVCLMIVSLLTPCGAGLALADEGGSQGTASYATPEGESGAASVGEEGGSGAENETAASIGEDNDAEATEANEANKGENGKEDLNGLNGDETNEYTDEPSDVIDEASLADMDENEVSKSEDGDKTPQAVSGAESIEGADTDKVTAGVEGNEETASTVEYRYEIVEEEMFDILIEEFAVAVASLTVNINVPDALAGFSPATKDTRVMVFEANDSWLLIQDDKGYPIMGTVTEGLLTLDGLTEGESYRFFVTGLPSDCVPEDGSGWIYLELPWFTETLTGYYQDVLIAADGQTLNLNLNQNLSADQIQETALFQILLAESFSVSFVIDGYSTEYSEQTIEDGGFATEPAAPLESLWPAGMRSFLGWFEDGAAHSFDFRQPIKKDLVLKAHFSDKYMIKFKDGYDGIVVDTVLVSPGGIIPQTDISVPPPTGYRLLYWVKEGTTNPGDPASAFAFGSERATANISLIPYFSNAYLIVFISQGAQVDPQIVAAGGLVVKPADPYRAGWTFSGWTLNDAPYDFNAPVNSDLILNTSWLPNTAVNYTVALWLEIPNYASGNPDAAPVAPAQGGSIGNYNYVGSVILTGTSGETTNLALGTLPERIVNLFNGTNSNPTDILRYAEFQGVENKVIQGNGSTVINLYAKRKVYTYEFLLGDAQGHSMNIENTEYLSGLAQPSYQLHIKYEMDIYNKYPVQGVDFVNFSDGFNFWYRPAGMADMSNIGSRRNVVDKGMLTTNGQTLRFAFTANWTAVGNIYNYRYLVEVYKGQPYTDLNSIVLNGVRYIVMEEFSQAYQGILNQKRINGLSMVNTEWETGGADSYKYQWRPYDYVDQDGFIYAERQTGPEYLRCFFYERIPYTMEYNGNAPARRI